MTAPDSGETRDGGGLSIVIAEDSPTQALWLGNILRAQGHSVVCARDGEEALREIRARPPQLLISDIVMPHMDGFALCRAVKSDPETSRVSVILATTLTEPADVLRGLEAGADNYLSKPFDAETVKARVAHVLDGGGARPVVGVEGVFTVDVGDQDCRIDLATASGARFMVSAIEDSADRNRRLEETAGQLREALQAASELEAETRALVDNGATAMCVTDLGGVVLHANRQAEALLGAGATTLVGAPSGFDVGAAQSEIDLPGPDGARRTCDVRVAHISWRRQPCLLVSLWDTTETARLRDELRSLSLTDELTGVCNRRGFLMLAQQQFRVAKRRRDANQSVALLYADVDGMKIINDTFGHKTGDEALVEVASMLRVACRQIDIIGRIGGDEFVAMLVDCSSAAVDQVRRRFEELLTEAEFPAGSGRLLMVSVGMASASSEEFETLEDMVLAADERMYAVKETKASSRGR